MRHSIIRASLNIARLKASNKGLLLKTSLMLPLGLLLVGGSAQLSYAQEVNFAGKTVRMILGQAAGGGADVSARLIAAFLGKYLPGSPVIIVQNMPGANGIT